MDHLDIQIRPSKLHLALLLAVHSVCFPALWLTEQPIWFLGMLAVFVLVSFIYTARFALLCHPLAIGRIEAYRGRWRLTLANGEIRKPTLIGEVLVLPWLIVARFRDQEARFSLVLLPDNVSVRDHRLSRVYFSLYAYPQVP